MQNMSATFHQFRINLSSNPLLHLRQVLDSLKEKSISETNPGIKEGYDIRLKNLESFLNFVEGQDPTAEIKYLKMSNVGEQALGIETILLDISIPSSQFADKETEQRILDQVYSNDDPHSKNTYFQPTRIPGILEWWEKGEEREEFFGKVFDDTLRGFIKLNYHTTEHGS